jgi:pimeloyl-ACP methyl ester carboxylesterase
MNKRRIFISFSTIVILFLIAAFWQYTMSSYEIKQLNYPGKLIEVNNHKMHIYSTGNGSKTVILTVGSGTPCAYTDYYHIQNELSKVTRTVSYDRPGFGWSESTTVPRTIDNQVADLHELLNKAGEKPPYILVGHSLASLEVIHYAQKFPDEVYGIVLLDGGNPEYYAGYYEYAALAMNIGLEGMRKSGLFRATGNLGFLPPIVGENDRNKLLPTELKRIDEIMFYNKLGNAENRSALRYINENAKKVIEAGKLGSIPLTILSVGEDPKWMASQEALKTWSINSEQEFISGAAHYIHWSEPEIVIKKILKLVNDSQL